MRGVYNLKWKKILIHSNLLFGNIQFNLLIASNSLASGHPLDKPATLLVSFVNFFFQVKRYFHDFLEKKCKVILHVCIMSYNSKLFIHYMCKLFIQL